MSIKEKINESISKIVLSKFKRKQKAKKTNIFKEAMDNPENFKMEIYVENEEIIIKVKRKEIEEV